MKKFLSLILVFAAVFALASCDKKKSSKKEAEVTKVETVSKEISAEEGGKVESSDGKTSIEIPGGALDADTTITMTIRDSSYLPGKEDEKVISNVVELGPSGTIFKKPVVISMMSLEKVENKIITAAVYHENEKEWSYSEDAAVKFSGYAETGDPIMTTATGDPIMLNATGDPIMQSATGDPIMLAATGDPIMMTATGDPIMQTATGDPIMMTTGHFTSFSFIVVQKGSVEENDDDSDDADDTDDADTSEEDDSDTTDSDTSDDDDEPVDDADTDTSEIDEGDTDTSEIDDGDTDTGEIEPEPVYSKVVCTGQTKCSDGESIIDCPAEGGELYGQDAQYVSKKSCLPHSFVRGETIEVEENIYHRHIYDEATALWWLFAEPGGTYEAAESVCENADYGGMSWRLPTPKELMSILHSDFSYPSGRTIYFPLNDSSNIYWSSTSPAAAFGLDSEDYVWALDFGQGLLEARSMETGAGIACVSGEEYGKVGDYITDGDDVVKDPVTDLMWQKTYVGNKTLAEAFFYCETLESGGYNDWRLPNKNELVSLIDYSNSTGKPASSFPDMPDDMNFWTSTFVPTYGGAEGFFIVNTASGKLLSSWQKEISEASVRCVRSDTESYPEGKTIPYCDATGYAPCEDPVSHYVWSQVVVNDMDFNVSHEDLAVICSELNQGGISNWRIPTIDELRTILSRSDKLKTEGSCNVTDDCNELFEPECFEEELCMEEDHIGFESDLNDNTFLISGTLAPSKIGEEGTAWIVNLKNGSFEPYSGDDIFMVTASRCIMDDSPMPEIFILSD